MKKVISLGFAFLFFCSSLLAQPARNIDNKKCYPIIWPTNNSLIYAASKKQNILLDNFYSTLPEFYMESREEESNFQNKWAVLNIQKPGSFMQYEGASNAICETHTLDKPPKFPIKKYKGLKIHMNR